MVTVFNGADSLPEMRRRLGAVLQPLGDAWQVVFIDDGSADASWSLIRQFWMDDARFGGIRFDRNVGEGLALAAGIAHVDAAWTVFMDGDLQDRPEDIPRLLASRAGVDVVAACSRGGRRGLRAVLSPLFYRLWSVVARAPVLDGVGVFSVLSRNAVLKLRAIQELRPPPLPRAIARLGLVTALVDVDRDARFAGRSSYSALGLTSLALRTLVRELQGGAQGPTAELTRAPGWRVAERLPTPHGGEVRASGD